MANDDCVVCTGVIGGAHHLCQIASVRLRHTLEHLFAHSIAVLGEPQLALEVLHGLMRGVATAKKWCSQPFQHKYNHTYALDKACPEEAQYKADCLGAVPASREKRGKPPHSVAQRLRACLVVVAAMYCVERDLRMNGDLLQCCVYCLVRTDGWACRAVKLEVVYAHRQSKNKAHPSRMD